ncbi:hypothetical protein Pan216_21050 [Planctomycetes bacterium Pan216]|uniref:Transmembrane protein n=1 Tax=Kolteria novifilia TaxID=2527975 RepID=A0A518B2N4_9BACT|nr:hypothetical protein Pan216_21050 [Planctomycetes bacterium Pan216]
MSMRLHHRSTNGVHRRPLERRVRMPLWATLAVKVLSSTPAVILAVGAVVFSLMWMSFYR